MPRVGLGCKTRQLFLSTVYSPIKEEPLSLNEAVAEPSNLRSSFAIASVATAPKRRHRSQQVLTWIYIGLHCAKQARARGGGGGWWVVGVVVMVVMVMVVMVVVVVVNEKL